MNRFVASNAFDLQFKLAQSTQSNQSAQLSFRSYNSYDNQNQYQNVQRQFFDQRFNSAVQERIYHENEDRFTSKTSEVDIYHIHENHDDYFSFNY